MDRLLQNGIRILAAGASITTLGTTPVASAVEGIQNKVYAYDLRISVGRYTIASVVEW